MFNVKLKIMKKLMFAALACTMVFAFASCREKTAKEKMEDRLEEVKESMEDAIDEAQDQLEDGAEDLKDALDEAGVKLKK